MTLHCASSVASGLTVKNLCNDLANVDWFMPGIEFGVQPNQLRALRASNPTGGAQQWQCDMFDFWLRNCLTASWEDVAKALQKMEENAVAESIRQKYITNNTMVTGECNVVTV